MAGLGFIHLGFLAAAAAVAVPILIHLLFRPRARKVEIGSLWFLRLVMQDSARRRKVRRWILLALRAFGVLLLALLFARPYRIDAAASGSEREVVFLIDRSASMSAGGGQASPFAKAQREAAEILKDLPAGTTAHLAYFDAEGAEPEREARIDTTLEPRPAGTDFGKALAWARDIAIASRRQNREVLLWTDLQRAGMRSRLEPPFPTTGVRLRVSDAGRPITRNLAVDLVEAEQTDLRKGKPVRITARIFNVGFFPARDVPVSLVLDGTRPIEQKITIEGRARALVTFETPITEPRLYSGFVQVKGDDELPFDDRRYIAFEARLPERVLLVDGQPGPSVFGNETYYLETALRLGLPGDAVKEAPPTPYVPVRIEAASPAFALPDLTGFRVVVLCNVAGVSQESAASLSRFVEAGGSLVTFVGDRAGASGYTTLQSAEPVAGPDRRSRRAGPVPDCGVEEGSPDPRSLRGSAARRPEDLAISEDRADRARARGTGARRSAGRPADPSRADQGPRAMRAVCYSRGQRLGRMGRPPALCAPGSPGRGVSDRPAPGDWSRAKCAGRPSRRRVARREDRTRSRAGAQRRPGRIRRRTNHGGEVPRDVPAARNPAGRS